MIEALEKLKAGNTLILFQSSSFRRAIKIQILAFIKKVYIYWWINENNANYRIKYLVK